MRFIDEMIDFGNTPDEVFEFSLEIDDQLRMDVSLYDELLEHTHS